jgi:hypothetical protein
MQPGSCTQRLRTTLSGQALHSAHMLWLLRALLMLYPCGHCMDDLRECLRCCPPGVPARHSRVALRDAQ